VIGLTATPLPPTTPPPVKDFPVTKIFAVMGLYEALIGSYLSTFRDNISIQSSRIKYALKMERTGFSETSVTNYKSTPRNVSQQRRPHLYRGGNLQPCSSQCPLNRRPSWPPEVVFRFCRREKPLAFARNRTKSPPQFQTAPYTFKNRILNQITLRCSKHESVKFFYESLKDRD
jgi:hypothetical protein